MWDQYPHIVGWEKIPAWDHPACLSLAAILRMLASSTVMIYGTISTGTGACDCRRGSLGPCEKPDAVLRAIRRYLND